MTWKARKKLQKPWQELRTKTRIDSKLHIWGDANDSLKSVGTQ